MQVTTTSPHTRRRPFAAVALAALVALVAGSLTSVQSEAATKYPYSAPPSVAVANVGKDYAEIVFGTVTGAPRYRIKAEALDSKGKVISGKTKTTSTGPEGFWTITGLSPATKYKFTVAVEQPSPVKLLSKYSKKSATATTNPSTYLDAPISLQTRDDPNDNLDKNGQRPFSIDLMWVAPAGFDPAIHQFQIDYATDRVMKADKGNHKTAGTKLPPSSAQTMDLPEAEVDPAEETPTEAEPTEEPTTESPSAPTETAEPSEPATETPSADPSSEPTEPTVEPSAEQPSETPAENTSPAAAEETAGQVAARPAGSPADVVLLGAPIRPAVANATAAAYWAQVPNLDDNTNWYMRVKIVNKSTGAVVSERSEAAMVKTLSPKGYITGTVNLKGEAAKNYVVAAYRGTDLHDQADVASNGKYMLSVRPGTYQVVAVYIGSGNLSSRWAATDTTKGRTRTDAARSVTVKVAEETAGVNITPQSQSTYTVSGDIDCPGASASQCTVDVAAMSTWGTSRVVTQARSSNSGGFTLKGLPNGDYKLRISHADQRYKVKEISVKVDGANVTGKDGTLAERSWIKTYPAKIKKTGSTVKVTSKAYIASELPVVRAVQRCQWQRNKVNISGATSCTYKLKAADRGKSIRVRIINERYGFPDATTYSKAVRG